PGKLAESVRSCATAALVAVLCVMLSDASRAQAGATPRDRAPAPTDAGQDAGPRTMESTLLGRVIGIDGAPIRDAVVVSDLGGKAVTDASGSFVLRINVPESASTLHMTAAASSGGRNLVGTQAVLLTAGAFTTCGPITVEQATTCQSAWLPMFGGLPGVD